MKAIKWIIVCSFFHLTCFQHGRVFSLYMTDSVIVNENNMLDQTDFPLSDTGSNEEYTVCQLLSKC